MKTELINNIKETADVYTIDGEEGVLIFEGSNNVVFKAFDDMTVEELIEVEPLETYRPDIGWPSVVESVGVIIIMIALVAWMILMIGDVGYSLAKKKGWNCEKWAVDSGVFGTLAIGFLLILIF